jgi:hypothetical protein
VESEKLVSCSYEWPENVRTKLRIAALFSNMTMSDLSALAVDVIYHFVESLREAGIRQISSEYLKHIMPTIIEVSTEISNKKECDTERGAGMCARNKDATYV